MAREDSSLHAAVPALQRVKLSIVIPCYNEEKTLEDCVDRVLAIADDTLELELIVVDDCSKDKSQGSCSCVTR
jgi:cellulose synthase/poly-beta-1,6-N-acetylglucosamine synthase-like glycosyltransferase